MYFSNNADLGKPNCITITIFLKKNCRLEIEILKLKYDQFSKLDCNYRISVFQFQQLTI